MSEKQDNTKAVAGNVEPPPETMKSIPERTSVFDLDVSAEVVTVPPPALAGAADSLKIPPPPPAPRAKASSQPTLAKQATPMPAATKRTPTLKDDDDRPSFFDVFDVERHEAKHMQPEAAPEKPADKAAQRGSRPDPREISRSRKIVDEDLFNLSSSLFNNQGLTPLVAPDVSALGVSALGKDLTSAPKPADAAAGKADAANSGGSLFLAAPPITAPPAPVTKSSMDAIDLDVDVAAATGKLDRKRLGIGVVLVAALAGLVFFLVQRASTTTEEPTAAVATESTTTPGTGNDAPLALQPGSTNQAPTPNTNTPAPSDPGAAAKAGTEAPADKRAGSADAAPKGEGRDKPAAGGDKPPENAKPVETASANKTQDLAAAMAAANNKPATPEPPSGGGNEFSRSAAASALGAAAGRASGCKAPGDPSGTARVSVTFAPSGRATKAQVNGPPFAGTPTGGCIAAAFRSASVPPFSGDSVTVSKSVTIR
ncbi:hypothetical protein [Polyangium sorediatum]|uniref:Uncharacterized protein n=1 Tax=Polyangium sorediatum TaxID=889274 RepID=A0ABT6P0W2_9BACT|nr:hypothetical protein [Polyangium sorediatum]MDI1434234.1 hypothetical protein [Polyangium sorediatum]